MTLTSGTRLGAFVITGPIGAGGMGEVYRAHDTTLDRDVAVKVLPDEFATDADRLARFRREAQVLAALNHPNIATIHGIEESAGVRALILELIEGPTLAEWIVLRSTDKVTRNTFVEIVEVARQIAEALDAAHERGIVHRDLKPANVKISGNGRVKVLDFGLARIHEPAEARSAPTVNALRTEAGVVLGTVPYMSPEQARGTVVDRRTDIWAFGCILYELLTGRQAFPSGETASDTLAAVLARDPDWTALPAATPARLRGLVERCLRKDPRHRLRDIGDALLELESFADDAATSAAPLALQRRRREYAWAAVAVLALVTAAVAMTSRRPAVHDADTVAFTVQAPHGGVLDVGQPLAPNGRKLAFVAASSTGTQMIWVRSIDSPTPRALEGTEGASNVFWSPDSEQLGFFAGGRLKRISAEGGASQVICAVVGFKGASWGSRGVILIGARGALLRVSAAGGQPVPATTLNDAAGDQFHVMPDFLPDGRHFLFVVLSGGISNGQAFVGDLDSNDRVALPGIRSGVRFAAAGHVLFTRDNALMAQKFDAATFTLAGEPFQIAGDARGRFFENPFSASANGGVAYLAQPDTGTELQWFDRSGTPLGAAGPRDDYNNPELSPDDGRIGFDLGTNGNYDIWALDIATGIKSRVTTNKAADYQPLWSPDGRSIGFTSYRSGIGNLYRREIDVVADDTLIQESTMEQRLSDWARDDRYLVYEQDQQTSGDQQAAADIWAVSLRGRPDPIRITNTPFAEHNPRLSPDARSIAYESNESGRVEVYVQAFPQPRAKQQVSVRGGRTPRWKPDGTELYYLTNDGVLMALSVSAAGDGLRFGEPSRLFRVDISFVGGPGRVLNVSRDGRFLLNVVPADRAPSSLVVLHNWAPPVR